MQTHKIIPRHQTGYELPKNFYIVAPHPTKNLVTNPSFERDLFGWSGYANTQRSGLTSHNGGYSARLWGDGVTADNDVGIDSTVTIPADGVYTASAYILYPFSLIGNTYEARLTIWQTTPANILAVSSKLTETDWQRVSATASLSAGVAGVSLYLGTNDATRIAYFDGVQLEAGGVASTYFDGDSVGFGGDDTKKYFWLGVPHRSESRRLATRSGGKIENIADYGLALTNYSGVNFTGYENTSTDLALQPGALYRRTVANQREFSLTGIVCGQDLTALQCDLFGLERRVKPNIATSDGLLRILYQDCHCSGRLLEIDAVYDGGLEGNISGLYQQQISLNFIAYNPFFKRLRERGQALAVSDLVTTQYLAIRQTSGQWQAPTTKPDADVFALEYFGDELYAMGSFTNAGPTVLDGFGIYDGGTWATAISFAGVTPSDFTVAPDGTFYFLEQVGGQSRVSYWRIGDPSRTTLQTWADSDEFRVIQSDNRGVVFVGGNKGRVERYDGATWATFVENVNGEIFDIDINRAGDVSIVGNFLTSGATGKEVADETIDTQLFCEPKPDLTPVELDVQIKIVSTEGTVINATTDNNSVSDDDPIVTYSWSNDGNANTESTRDITAYDLLPAPLVDFVTLTMVATTASGKTITQTILYFIVDEEEGEKSLQIFRASDDSEQYSLISAVPFTANCCISDTEDTDCENATTTETSGLNDADPVASYDWSNDANANTYTGKSVTMDLSGTTPGGQVVVTLTTTTESGAANVNTITLDYSTDLLLTENSKTSDIYAYTIITQAGGIFPFVNFMTFSGGAWDGQLSGGICYSVKSVDERIFVGNGEGITEFENSELRLRGGAIGQVKALTIDDNDNVIAAGQQGVFRWDGFSLLDLGLRFQIGIRLDAVAAGADGLLAVGYNSTKSLRAAGHTTVSYSGSVESKPRIVIRGPGRLLEVRNETTEQGLVFDYEMGAGEFVEVILDGQPSARSSFLQDVPFEVGTKTEMFLLEGDNDIICFVDGADSTTEATLITRPTHHGINALCCADDTDERSDVQDIPVAPCCGYDFVISDKNAGCDDSYEVGTRWYNPFTGAFVIRAS